MNRFDQIKEEFLKNTKKACLKKQEAVWNRLVEDIEILKSEIEQQMIDQFKDRISDNFNELTRREIMEYINYDYIPAHTSLKEILLKREESLDDLEEELTYQAENTTSSPWGFDED